MKASARVNLFQNTTAFDDPLEMLFACHRKIEKQLETMERLRLHLGAKGIDADASSAAHSVLRYFARAAQDHHDDEEVDLFPMLERRIDEPQAAEAFRALRASLAADHRKLESQWTRLRKPLEGIAEGLMRSLPEEEMRDFAAAYERHIATEETLLRQFVERWLETADRNELGRSMSARRASNLRGL